MTRDEHSFPEPEAFRPERYMPSSGIGVENKLMESQDTNIWDGEGNPNAIVFGFGRR